MNGTNIGFMFILITKNTHGRVKAGILILFYGLSFFVNAEYQQFWHG